MRDPIISVLRPLPLSADERRRLLAYRPNSLDPSVWAVLCEPMWRLVAGASPTGFEDARKLVIALAAYLAHVEASSLDRLEDVVTEAGITSLVARLKAAGQAKTTVQNQRARLERLLGVLTGQPPKPKRQRDRSVPPVYSAEEIGAYVDAMTDADAPSGFVISVSAGLAAGLVMPDVVGVRVERRPAGVVAVLANGAVRVGDGPWAALLQRLPDEELDRAGWEAARRWVAARDGLAELRADRLARTWLAGLLATSDEPFAVLLARHQHVGRKALDAVIGHLPVDVSDRAEALRAA